MKMKKGQALLRENNSFLGFKSNALICHLNKFANESNIIWRFSRSFVTVTSNCIGVNSLANCRLAILIKLKCKRVNWCSWADSKSGALICQLFV